MTTPPDLFDDALLDRRRQRAARAPADFLQRAVASEIAERLSEVNRPLSDAVVIGPRAGVWGDALEASGRRRPDTIPDAPVLDLASGSRDLVIHALALHWANDPVGQLVQCRRALRPDGLFVAALFGGRTLHELRTALAEAEIAQTGGLSPRVAPMAEIRDLGALLQRAGFALPVADSARFDVTYADAFALMRDLRAMAETSVLRDRLRRPTSRRLFAHAAALYAERFAEADGRVRATFDVVVLTGWAPAASQPKPLRPGSARTRLADALGVPAPPPATGPAHSGRRRRGRSSPRTSCPARSGSATARSDPMPKWLQPPIAIDPAAR